MSAAERIEYACPRCGATNRIPVGRLGDGPGCGRCHAALFPPVPASANDGSFAGEVERSPLPVLVDFWAPWCGPCRAVAPVLEALARERAGRLRVVKVNVDESPRTATRFAVRSIPSLKLFRDGALVASLDGAVPKARLEAFLAHNGCG